MSLALDAGLLRTAEAPVTVGAYQLVRRIGSGGMGEVWLGRHDVSGALGAVKRLQARRRNLGQWFEREARALAKLAHPHIVPVFEVGPDFLVTAYIDGGSLSRRLNTPMKPAEALRIARYIADALAHAHARGVVHRDVKPSNILLDRRGTPYLTDFGLATFVGEEETPRAAGTPQFMAPEQRRGGAIGPAADQYALGRTLLEMLAGGAVPVDPVSALAELPASLPDGLRAAIARATAVSPDDRFADMAAFEAALASVELEALSAPRRRAALVRDAQPFAWLAGAHTTQQVGPDLERADFRMRDLAANGWLDAGAVDEMLDRAGIAELGFAAWGATHRLGALTAPSALAAASDVVILLHGWGHTREVWSLIARTLCRDNARAIVLAPDLHGFGEAAFPRTPRPEQAGTAAMMRVIDDWRRLLGLAAIPTALVGHSMTGLAVLGVGDAAAGVHVTRIAINPTLVSHDPALRRTLKWQALFVSTLGRIGLVRRAVIRSMEKKAIEVERVTPEAARFVADQTIQLAPGTTAAMMRALAATPVRLERQQRLAVVACTDDPWIRESALARMLSDAGVEEANLHRLPSGGHHPHVEKIDHPEFNARNAADLVRIIDAMLVTAGEAESTGDSSIGFGSTVPAMTTLSS
jgi:predicted Ser/Thr protein kinase